MGGYKKNNYGIKIYINIKQVIYSEDMTSQTDNQIGNLCSDFHCSKVLPTLKIHNFLISYSILLKLVLIGLSDFSASIESKLFLEWTCPLTLNAAPPLNFELWFHDFFSSSVTHILIPFSSKSDITVRC